MTGFPFCFFFIRPNHFVITGLFILYCVPSVAALAQGRTTNYEWTTSKSDSAAILFYDILRRVLPRLFVSALEKETWVNLGNEWRSSGRTDRIRQHRFSKDFAISKDGLNGPFHAIVVNYGEAKKMLKIRKEGIVEGVQLLLCNGVLEKDSH